MTTGLRSTPTIICSIIFFFSSRRRHTRSDRDWSSDVCSSDLLVTGSFMDYAMPRADDLPLFKDAIHAVPAKTNPLGVKGAGEAGTTAAIAALMNRSEERRVGKECRSRWLTYH